MDTIADYLTRVRNAGSAGHTDVSLPYSKMKEQISKVLHSEGYIKSYEAIDLGSNKKDLKIILKYYKGEPVIEGLRRMSKCSCRTYVKRSEIPSVRNGLGMAVLSTSKGIMTGKKAREENIGGELLCYVW